MDQTISIITPWLDHPEFIPDYERAVGAPGVEAIVIDNGSAAANATALADMVGRVGGKYIRNEKNRWFAAANNQGLAAAAGETIVFLNNDISADPTWIDAIRRDVKQGALYGAGLGEVSIDGRTLNYLAGWCIAVKRSDIDRLGGWDATTFEMPYWEDADLCVRAFKAGMKLVHVNWPVRHKQNGTSASVPGLPFAFRRNLELLTSRLRGTAAPAAIECREPNDFVVAGRVAEGERIYAEAVGREPDRADLWTKYGQILEASARFEAAEQAFGRAISLDPKAATPHEAWAMLLLRTQRLADSIREFRIAAELNPHSAQTLAMLGFALCANGEHRQSVDAARESLRLDPTHLAGALCLSDALRELGELEEALAVGQAAQRHHPNIPDSYRVMGMALHRLNRLEEARQVLHQAISIDPYTQATRAEYQAVLDKLAAKS